MDMTPSYGHHVKLWTYCQPMDIRPMYGHHVKLWTSRQPMDITSTYGHHADLWTSRQPMDITPTYGHHADLWTSRHTLYDRRISVVLGVAHGGLSIQTASQHNISDSKTTHTFLIVLLTGFEPSFFGSESDALPTEPPRHRNLWTPRLSIYGHAPG